MNKSHEALTTNVFGCNKRYVKFLLILSISFSVQVNKLLNDGDKRRKVS